jgi:TRAP-type mannitol/chloroaromatic compound transport system permease large subunit
MTAFLIANMAPIMFASLVIMLLLGYPAAFSLGAVGDFLQALPERVYGVMNNDTLLAIPFFTFMGLVLERSGMAEDLLDTIGQLFGTIRGGLAYAVVFVGALLAATTGVVAASVISMGLISLPIMLRYGYDRRMATGIIAASGTLAQIIPPSLVLIVMADQLGKSVGDMYEGAFIPGIVLAGLYAGYAFLVTLIFPKAAPGLPPEAIGFREKDGSRGLLSLGVLALASVVFGWFMMRHSDTHGADYVVLSMFYGILFAFFVTVLNWVIDKLTGFRFLSAMAQQTTFVMVPPLFLIFLVLGTIFIGIATPTEGGAMGAAGAIILGAAPDRSAGVLADLLRRERSCMGRASADLPPRRPGWFPHFRQRACLRSCLLPRLLRACLHHHPTARTGGGKTRHRPDLVRRDSRRQHADVVHAPSLRVRLVLSALGGAKRILHRPHHRKAHGPSDDRPDLLGSGAVRRHPGHHGRTGHPVPLDGDALQGCGLDDRSDHDQDRSAADRTAAAGFRIAQIIAAAISLPKSRSFVAGLP